MTPDHIDESVTIEEEVKWEVMRLWGHRLVGPSRMRAKNLQEWLRNNRAAEAVAKVEEKSDTEERKKGSE